MADPTIRSLIGESSSRTMLLGTYRLHVNPLQFTFLYDSSYVEAQTATGYGRWEFGAKARAYQFVGNTGYAGLHGPGGAADLEALRTQDGRAQPLLPLVYPSVLPDVRWVKVNSITRSGDAATPHTQSYTISVTEYPPSQTGGAAQVATGTLQTSLPAGG